MKRFLPFLIIAVAAIATVAGGVIFYRAKIAQLAPTTKVDQEGKVVGAKPGSAEEHVRGPSKAPVTLEEFGDFQCPPCGALATSLLRIEHDMGTQLRVVFRNFPLPMHNHSAEAARAAEAAGFQGKFWEMHDLLFRNQILWSKEVDVKPTFLDYAKEIGAEVERFERDYDGNEVRERIEADKSRGDSIGVESTPTLFINDRPLPPAQMNEPALRAALAAAARGEPIPTATPAPTAPPLPTAVPSTTPVATPQP